RSFERIAAGHPVETVLVSGAVGIGKTALAHEVLRQVTNTSGRSVAAFGKCRHPHSRAPGAALLDALDCLLRGTLEASSEEPEALRQRLVTALGVNLPLLGTLIPSLARIAGAPVPLGDVPIPETRGRLLLALDQFVGVFSSVERPVVLVLDDLQWADSTTLEVLTHWTEEARSPPMLIIATYRSEDVTPVHPLGVTLGRMRASGAAMSDIVLQPLGPVVVRNLLADLLRTSPDGVGPLATAVWQRTGGNPFFIVRLVEAVHRAGHIRYDKEARTWSWDLEAILAEPRTDGVAKLIAKTIADLPPATRNALGYFAAYGNSAAPATLATILGCSEDEVLLRLDGAFATRLISRFDGALRFLHDHIQQVAYELIDRRREHVHLEIARALLAKLTSVEVQKHIFEIVCQLELAGSELSDPAERLRAAELELMAGRRAQAATRFGSAARFLLRGVLLLTEEDWNTHHDVAFGLHFALARSRFVLGELEVARGLARTLVARAWSPGEIATVHGLLAELDLLQGSFDEAVAECIRGLHRLGVDVIPHPNAEVADAAAAAAVDRLLGCGALPLTELPPATDPEARAVCDLISSLLSPAALTDWKLARLAAAISVERSLKSGNASSSAIAYATLAVHVAGEGRYDDAVHIGQASFALAQREPNAVHRPRAAFVFLAFISYLSLPLRDCVQLLQREVDIATAIGDQVFACYLTRHAVQFRFFQGDAIAEVAADAEAASRFASRAGNMVVREQLDGLRRLLDRLRSPSVSDLKAVPFDDSLGRFAPPVRRIHYLHEELVARFLLGDHEGAALAAELSLELTGWIAALLEVTEVHFFAALAAAQTRAHGGEATSRRRAVVQLHHARLKGLASKSPVNFG
ncbi:MAG: Protein kinase, partial [Labilithrix sp.]|nr:Protein kinase [Labilithrix sp.]